MSDCTTSARTENFIWGKKKKIRGEASWDNISYEWTKEQYLAVSIVWEKSSLYEWRVKLKSLCTHRFLSGVNERPINTRIDLLPVPRSFRIILLTWRSTSSLTSKLILGLLPATGTILMLLSCCVPGYFHFCKMYVVLFSFSYVIVFLTDHLRMLTKGLGLHLLFRCYTFFVLIKNAVTFIVLSSLFLRHFFIL